MNRLLDYISPQYTTIHSVMSLFAIGHSPTNVHTLQPTGHHLACCNLPMYPYV